MIVMMSSKDVELDYATKGTLLQIITAFALFMCTPLMFKILISDFATDTSISRFNGLSGEKELEPWEGDGDDCNISLDNAVI